MRRTSRAAFTLVELLVVIAIIGILIALLLPAVQAAREAARRTQCNNNLKQLGLGIHSFHDVRHRMPAGVTGFSENGSPSPRNGKGWIVDILPQIEQASLYEEFEPFLLADFTTAGAGGGIGTNSPGLRLAMTKQLPALLCPTDSENKDLSTVQFQWTGIPVGRTNYKGCIGDTRMGGNTSIHTNGTMPDCHNNIGCNGLFYRNVYREFIRFSSILDGTSNTFAVGEDVPQENNHSAWAYSNGDYSSCHAPLNYFPKPPGSQANNWWNVISFRSRHPGGAQFCMADGSVRFVQQSISHILYRALSTRKGGEAVTVQ